jgi:hypothetical protein
MAKQYPIYVEQTNNSYSNGGKSYGVKDYAINYTKIGTSSRNSFDFIKTETSVTEDPATGRKHYSFRIDDQLVRSAEYDPKTKIMKMTMFDAEGVGTTYYDNTPKVEKPDLWEAAQHMARDS